MGTSFTIFRLFDIDVRVHWSFVLILAYGAFTYSSGAANPIFGMLFGILNILLLFACVTLHEFGHALVAQYYNIRVPHITLLPIGGVASLERMPEKPSQEFFITIAGPLVNFGIALILAPILYLLTAQGDGLIGGGLRSILGQMRQSTVTGVLTYLFITNMVLGIFNLLPAFPMDGGRILRSLLAMVLPYVQATNIAVWIGRLMAAILFITGIFTGQVLTMLVAFFVYVGGGSERKAVASRAVLSEFTARDKLDPDAVRLYTSESIARAVGLLTSRHQGDFPVMDLSGKFAGVLTRVQLIRSLQDGGQNVRIVDVMTPAAEVPSCTANTSLADVWEKMAHSGSRVMAVEGEKERLGEFLGVLTAEDVSQVFQEVQSRGRRNAPAKNTSAELKQRGADNPANQSEFTSRVENPTIEQ